MYCTMVCKFSNTVVREVMLSEFKTELVDEHLDEDEFNAIVGYDTEWEDASLEALTVNIVHTFSNIYYYRMKMVIWLL